MPKLGESITEGTIIQWRKEIGETVELDEILLEIGTDKVDSEIPSPAAGVVMEILAQPNDVLPVNEVIARIETEGEATAAAAPATGSRNSRSSSHSDACGGRFTGWRENFLHTARQGNRPSGGGVSGGTRRDRRYGPGRPSHQRGHHGLSRD